MSEVIDLGCERLNVSDSPVEITESIINGIKKIPKIITGDDTAKVTGIVNIWARFEDGELDHIIKDDHNTILFNGKKMLMSMLTGRSTPNTQIVAIQVGKGGATTVPLAPKNTDETATTLYEPINFRLHNPSDPPSLETENTVSWVSSNERANYANVVSSGFGNIVEVKYKLLPPPPEPDIVDTQIITTYRFTIDKYELLNPVISSNGSTVTADSSAHFNELGFIVGQISDQADNNGFKNILNPTLISHYTFNYRFKDDVAKKYEIEYGVIIS